VSARRDRRTFHTHSTTTPAPAYPTKITVLRERGVARRVPYTEILLVDHRAALSSVSPAWRYTAIFMQ
jgi:hypothetical protein